MQLQLLLLRLLPGITTFPRIATAYAATADIGPLVKHE